MSSQIKNDSRESNNAPRPSRLPDGSILINSPNRLNDDTDDRDNFEDGLAKLVLTVVKVLLDVVERQAARRVESGSLEKPQIERLGRALLQIRKQFARLCTKFGLDPSDLDLPLGNFHEPDTHSNVPKVRPLIENSPASRNRLGLTASSLVDIIDRLIEKRTTIAGDVTISLAGVELVVLKLLASLEPIEISTPKSNEQSILRRKESRGPRT